MSHCDRKQPEYGMHRACEIYPIPFMPMYVCLAHAYVPYQTYVNGFPSKEALERGTIFPELYQPYGYSNKCREGEK